MVARVHGVHAAPVRFRVLRQLKKSAPLYGANFFFKRRRHLMQALNLPGFPGTLVHWRLGCFRE